MPEHRGSLSLDEAAVDIWLTALDRLGDDLLGRYPALLAPGERERWQRFRVRGAADQYLVGRALLRTTLARYAPVAATDWAFETNAFGCPYVSSPVAHRDFRFNLSHTEGLVACAVTRRGEVGIDVESTARAVDPLALAPTVFAGPEIEALAAAPEAQRQQRFFAYWTLKEAYIKGRGIGISLPLDGFWFELDGPAPRIHFSERCQDQEERWHFFRWQASPTHAMALAVAPPARRAPLIRLRWIEPAAPPADA